MRTLQARVSGQFALTQIPYAAAESQSDDRNSAEIGHHVSVTGLRFGAHQMRREMITPESTNETTRVR
jgi:hypothetical protein